LLLFIKEKKDKKIAFLLVFISVVKRSTAVTYKEKTAPRQEVIMNTAS
jgi:hypothetical protein